MSAPERSPAAQLRPAHVKLLITALTPDGPVFSSSPPLRHPFAENTFVRALDATDRWRVALLTTVWLVTTTWFWVWWFQPDHRTGTVALLLNSVLLAYVTLLPCLFLAGINRLWAVSPDLPIPRLRVAFVVTKAPSEPWATVEGTLRAMLAQSFPHPFDVWLADEDPSPDTIDWCTTNGIQVCSRRGVEGYHRVEWPRRTRCKEGNLAYFYDLFGYDRYDVVAQLDCDHVPARDYLEEVVRPFADPSVGYVAAPSVCDLNAGRSWSARGRLHKEGTFHGPYQLGHQRGLAPTCIGSHYAVRTRALRDIGGLGPELAEDLSTTLLMNSAGWNGAFAHRAEAHGDGPLTVGAMVIQEFQWSRSLVVLLLATLPRHLGRLTVRQRFRFVHALSYYPLIAVAAVLGVALPAVAAATGIAWVDVNYISFLLRWWAIAAPLLLLTVLLRRRGLLRPVNAPVISWEAWLYTLVQWPYILRGVVGGVLQRTSRRVTDFRVTPKTSSGAEHLPTLLILPSAAISLLLSGAALVGELTTQGIGYVFLCLLGASCYGAAATAVPLLHAREASLESGLRTPTVLGATARTPFLLGLGCLLVLAVAIALFPGHVVDVLTPSPPPR